MKKAAVFLADGFEEVEALTPIDMLRRAGVEVTTVSIKESLNINGSHNIVVEADKLFEDVNYEEIDMFILPGGGPGTVNLENCLKLEEVLKKADADGKFISAICAAPRVLGKLGFLKGHKATCYPGNEKYLEGAEYEADARAVTDGRFVTARGMGTAIEFGSAVISQLMGEEKAREIESQIQFR
ncbi:MAG: DJ-1/PfpI family protein [Lachnospiraceae bacterium]|nr:DJ-1/PfpI family protein [Lachnospiraceae bacterium]